MEEGDGGEPDDIPAMFWVLTKNVYYRKNKEWEGFGMVWR